MSMIILDISSGGRLGLVVDDIPDAFFCNPSLHFMKQGKWPSLEQYIPDKDTPFDDSGACLRKLILSATKAEDLLQMS